MIVFIENLAGIQIVSNSHEFTRRWHLKFVRDSIAPWITNALYTKGPVIILQPTMLRWLKLILSVLQLPITQQDPTCLAFRLNYWRQIISDGLLTEYLVEELQIPVKQMHSIVSSKANLPLVSELAIIGSNWLEFGMMSEMAYIEHLHFLKRSFPEGYYYCHPKEQSTYPEDIFGNQRVIRPKEPIETYFQKKGVPNRLSGVCSSSMLALANCIEDKSSISVNLVVIARSMFDGPRKDIVERLKRPINNVDVILVGDIQCFLAKKLTSMNVHLKYFEC